MVIADSKSQCIDHGEICHAVKDQIIKEDKIIELGALIANSQERSDDSEITIADLTGVAIQDIQIAKYLYQKIKS